MIKRALGHNKVKVRDWLDQCQSQLQIYPRWQANQLHRTIWYIKESTCPLSKCKNKTTHQADSIVSLAVWIFCVWFLYPSFLFHQKHLEKKKNESKPTGDNSILLLKHWRSTASQSTSQQWGQEYKSSKYYVESQICKALETTSKHLIHVRCCYELLLYLSNYVSITFSWCLKIKEG